MKFRSLTVHGYGMLADTSVPSINDGLVLLEGPNGAGKSTLLEFITSMLFGYQTGRGSNKYAETPGGLRGGLLQIETQDGRVLRWERTTPPPADGKISVSHNGETLESKAWLGYANRDIYSSVFAIGLNELMEGSLPTERQTAVEAAITGMGVRGVTEALKSVEKQQGNVIKEIRVIQTHLDTAGKELDSAKVGTRRYDLALEELKTAEMRAAELKLEQKQAEIKFRKDTQLAKAWSPWCSFEESRRRAQDLKALPSFDEGSLERLRALRENEERLLAEIKRSDAELQSSVEQIKALQVDEVLLGLAVPIESLNASLHSLREAELGIEDRERALEINRQRLAAAFGLLGSEWDEERLARVDTSLVAHAEGAKLAKLVLDSGPEVNRRREQWEEKCRIASELEDELNAYKGRIDLAGETKNLREIDRQLDLIETVRAILNKTEIARSRLETLAEAIQSSNPETSPERKYWIAGAFIAIAMIAIAVVLKLPVLGVIGILLGIAIPLLLKPAKPASDDSRHNTIEALRAEISSLEEELRRIGSAENWKIASPADLVQLSKDLREARDVAVQNQGLVTRLGEIEGNLERAFKASREAEAAAQRASEQANEADLAWQNWCVEKGYPPKLTADSLSLFESRIEATRSALGNCSAASVELNQYRTRIDKARNQVEILKRQLGEPLPLGPVSDSIMDLGRRLEQNKNALREREDATKTVTAITNRLKSTQEDLAVAQRALADIFARAGVSTDSEFEQAFLESREAIHLNSEVSRSRELLVQISGPGEPFDQLVRDLSVVQDGDSLEMEAAESSESYERLTGLLKEAEIECVRLTQDLKNLESGADLGSALAKKSELQAEYDALREQWLELTLTQILLAEAREKFTVQVQEDVLLRASHYMKLLTDGASVEIRRDGETYMVIDKDQSKRSVNQLNRSHAERVLLAVRLGYIDNYCTRREPLPIVLDDILVNFDPGHQHLAVNMIAELATRHQVIYLTCHPSTRELFASQAEKMQHIRLNRWRFEPLSV